MVFILLEGKEGFVHYALQIHKCAGKEQVKSKNYSWLLSKVLRKLYMMLKNIMLSEENPISGMASPDAKLTQMTGTIASPDQWCMAALCAWYEYQKNIGLS